MTVTQEDGKWFESDFYLRTLKDPWYRALVEVQHTLTRSTNAFFTEHGLTSIWLPVTTNSISSPMGAGSDSLPVEVELFGAKTYLADSMQFMLEYGCRLTDGRGAYYLMPSFRGEPVDATHLTQFFHSEAEIQGTLDDVLVFVEDYIRELARSVLASCGPTLEGVLPSLSHLAALVDRRERFPRLTFQEAVTLLRDRPDAVATRSDGLKTLTRQGEQSLIERFGGFVWVTRFPHLSVPFYQAFAPDGESAEAADLLLGLGETVGAGERHADLQSLRRALELHEVDPAPYEWYLRLREVAAMRTSGFGVGMERLICWLLQHDDVRDCQLLPRGHRIVPGAP